MTESSKEFTPQKVTISVYGSGAEIVCGSISKEAYEFWNNDEYNEFLESHLLDHGDEPEDGIPDSAILTKGGAYFECDDLYHNCFPFVDEATVEICDATTGETIDEYDLSWEENTKFLEKIEEETGKYPDEDKEGLLRKGEEVDCSYDSMKKGHYAYVCAISHERGSFHTGEILLTRPYKRGDLTFVTTEVNERDIVINNGCMYLGKVQEDIELSGDSTNKGFDCFVEKNYDHPENKE